MLMMVLVLILAIMLMLVLYVLLTIMFFYILDNFKNHMRYICLNLQKFYKNSIFVFLESFLF